MIKVRYLAQDINNISFAHNKMAFVSGPRQCGKTTLAKRLLKERTVGNYYNWDELKFRKLWTKDPAQIIPIEVDNKKPLIILDEIHKAKLWKRNLKGVYDTLKFPCDILVTGSTHLNTYRKGSDSLLGRYHHFTLHPFSLAELMSDTSNQNKQLLIDEVFNHKTQENSSNNILLNELDKFGPFPEPLFSKDEQLLNLWQRGRLEKLIREDLRDLSRISELSQIEMFVSLLPERAANILSIRALSEDMEVAYSTARHWLNYLKALYYCYEIKPYHKLLIRSAKKSTKLYLWDWSEIENEATRFENLIASHLLKYCDYMTDVGFGQYELRYLRSKSKQEIDFLIVKDNKPWLPIEVKLNEEKLSENWKAFIPHLPCKRGIQIVKKENVFRNITTEYGEILIISASIFLSYLV